MNTAEAFNISDLSTICGFASRQSKIFFRCGQNATNHLRNIDEENKMKMATTNRDVTMTTTLHPFSRSRLHYCPVMVMLQHKDCPVNLSKRFQRVDEFSPKVSFEWSTCCHIRIIKAQHANNESAQQVQ